MTAYGIFDRGFGFDSLLSLPIRHTNRILADNFITELSEDDFVALPALQSMYVHAQGYGD